MIKLFYENIIFSASRLRLYSLVNPRDKIPNFRYFFGNDLYHKKQFRFFVVPSSRAKTLTIKNNSEIAMARPVNLYWFTGHRVRHFPPRRPTRLVGAERRRWSSKQRSCPPRRKFFFLCDFSVRITKHPGFRVTDC